MDYYLNTYEQDEEELNEEDDDDDGHDHKVMFYPEEL
jgi:hypothetical protein